MKNLKNKYPIFTFGEETQKEIIALIEEERKKAQSEMREDLIRWAEENKAWRGAGEEVIVLKDLNNFFNKIK